jgi:hypothetical protein
VLRQFCRVYLEPALETLRPACIALVFRHGSIEG